MKVDPPIRCSLPEGDGHVIELQEYGEVTVVTVKLLSGEIIKVDGNRPANLHRDDPE